MAVTKKKVALVAPVKRFNTKDDELVEIKMNRQARQARIEPDDDDMDFSAMSTDELLDIMADGLKNHSIDDRSLMEILYDGRR
jgi:hypothetical protein